PGRWIRCSLNGFGSRSLLPSHRTRDRRMQIFFSMRNPTGGRSAFFGLRQQRHLPVVVLDLYAREGIWLRVSSIDPYEPHALRASNWRQAHVRRIVHSYEGSLRSTIFTGLPSTPPPIFDIKGDILTK